MAWLSVNFNSKALKRPVDIEVLMPQNRKASKVLFLLHGAMDGRNGWLLKTQVECLAEEKNLCVVMPDGMNSFYVNTKNSYKFMDYICDELPMLIESMIHVPVDKNDWMIAGCSMGGYGALRCGINANKKFGRIAVFSGAIDVADLYENSEFTHSFADVGMIFGKLEELNNSDNNLYKLMDKFKEEQVDMKILLTCGSKDGLLPYSKDFYGRYKDCFDMVFLEKDGGHDWYFWNSSLHCAVEWFCGNADFREVF